MLTESPITRGETVGLSFTVDHLPAGGLNAGTLALEVWRDYQDADAIITNATPTIVDPGSDVLPGVARFTLTPSDTSGLPPWQLTLYTKVWFTETITGVVTCVNKDTLEVAA